MEIAILANQTGKIKENEKKDKYLDRTEKLWNIKVTVISIVIGARGMIPKYLERGP